MSIRIKLALLLVAGMAVSSLAAALVFVQLQRATLRAAQEEKIRIIVEDIARLGAESQLAKDPLMLLDYLGSLKRDKPEVHHCRMLMAGTWNEVGGAQQAVSNAPGPDDPSAKRETAGKKSPPKDLLMRTVDIPAPNQDPQKAIKVEAWFSMQFLARQERIVFELMVRDITRAVGIVMLLAALLSAALGWTLTRRIVFIESALREIGEGNLGVKVQAKGSDEVAHLARGVNAMTERLKELENVKKTFVASVTHELRSPLGAIESYVKGLLSAERKWPEEDRRNLERIRDNAARLGHFVTNLLEMSKIERGKLSIYPRQAHLGKLVEDTVIFFGAKAKETGIRLDYAPASELPEIRMDPDLIAQVISNFLSNALKFTRPNGAVKVETRLVEDAGRSWLECAVTDTGVGIPREAMDRIFTPFERVKNPLRATGAGLGLAISKNIIDMHQGRIGVQSQEGKGSRFYFMLPVSPSS